MTIHHQSHRDRIDAGLSFEWDKLPPRFFSVADIPGTADELSFHRERNSHRGISDSVLGLRRLWAYGVNQDFLNEICQIDSLELLYAEKVTASDPTPLSSLPVLRQLVIKDAPKIENLEWIKGLTHIKSLGLENVRRVDDIVPLSELNQLVALGIEGSMWTSMRIGSLKPRQP